MLIKKIIISLLIITSFIGISLAEPTPDILYLKFDNETSKGESITLAVDSVNNHNATIANMTDYETGFLGSALDLSDPNLATSIISDHTDLTFGTGTPVGDLDYTFSFFIQCEDYDNMIIFTKDDEYSLYTNATGYLVFESRDVANVDIRTVTSDISLNTYENEWTHIVITSEFPDGVTQMYYNNEKTVTDNIVKGVCYSSMYNTNSNFIMGYDVENYKYHLDELLIYSTLLQDDDVEELYQYYYPPQETKMHSMWELIRDITDNVGTIINLIVLSIMITLAFCIGTVVTSIIKTIK